MKLKEIADKLNLEVKSGIDQLEREVKGGYVSDLLSDVLANAEDDDLWITLQIHPNIVAIAAMKGLAGIVMIGGREPQEDTLVKAKEENVAILLSKMPAFELSGKLYAMGLSGAKDNAEGV